MNQEISSITTATKRLSSKPQSVINSKNVETTNNITETSCLSQKIEIELEKINQALGLVQEIRLSLEKALEKL